MATYIQGVKDYIPQFQPFQPDLNLYANVLQTKQTQYDTAYKSLNNLYGQYFYSELSRDSNIQRKEEILKNVDFNLKRVASLDLSLDQNVQQAVKVFKPFYEDKYIMKDMAWTKNYSAQRGRAEGLKNSQDEKQRAQYWDTGVRALDYRREEFKSLGDDESLGFQNAEYTPYINIQEKALKIAKDAGLSVESIDFSPDQRWIIKTKNGEQLMEPLSKLFEATLGSDPGVQAVYKTQAYVNRKDYAYSNAAQFGGDQNAAEMKYLENSYNILKEQNQQRYNALKQQSVSYDSKIADLQKQIKRGNATPSARQSLAQYEEAKRINDTVLDRIDAENRMLNEDKNGTANTQGFQNPYGDVESLRWKVDNGMAAMLMQKDLDEAAQVYAYRDQSVDVDANPYAVNEQKFQQDLALANVRGNYMLKAAELRNRGEKQNNIDKYLVERGTHQYDTDQTLPDGSPNPNYGRAIPLDIFNHVTTEGEDETTGEINMKNMDRKISKLQVDQVAMPHLTNMVTLVDQLIGQNQMSKEEAKQIFGMDYISFNKKLQASPEWFLRRELGSEQLANINSRFKNWISKNKDLSGLDSESYNALSKSSLAFDDYTGYLKASQNWRKETSKVVESELYNQGFKYVKYLYDKEGNLRSEKEFYAALPESVKSEYAQITARRTNPNRNWRDEGGVTDQEIGVEQNIVGGRTYKRELNYTDMVNAAAKAYSSSRIKKDPVVGMAQFADFTGTGTFTTGRSTILVNPKAPDTPNYARFASVLNDLSNFDFKSDQASIRGIGASAKKAFGEDESIASKSNTIAEAILSKMKEELNNPMNTKMGNFKTQVAPLAFGLENKAAIVIRPDAEWLKTLVYKKDKDGKVTSAGIISAEQYDRIIKNGLAFVMNSNKMTNSLYTNAFQTPLQSIVDYNGRYEYADPLNSDRKIVITKNPLGTSDYRTEVSFPYVDFDGNMQNQTVIDNVGAFGGQLDDFRNNMIAYFNQNQQALRTPLIQ